MSLLRNNNSSLIRQLLASISSSPSASALLLSPSTTTPFLPCQLTTIRTIIRKRRAPPTAVKQMPLCNEEIRVPMVRAIIPSTYSSSTRSSEDSSNGEGSPGGGKEKGESKSELMKTKDALNLAKSLGLDLVLVASKTDPPVARIVEWNKLAFEMNKKLKEKEKSQRESQKKAEPKEIRLSHNIAQHDLSMKLAQARKFLQGGSHLKLQVESKRFENIPQGRVTLLKAIDELKDDCFLRNPDQVMRPYGRHWQVQLAPLGAENKASSNITEELLSSKFKPPPPPQPTSSSSLHFRSSR